jgi:phosphatidylserine decarboxylase
MPPMRRSLPFAPEGWIFLIPVVILFLAALLIQWTIAAIILGLLALFLINFFRDPRRAGSEHHVDVLSPADGTVVQIKDVPDGEVWAGLTRQVSIFMSVFDVHVNRAPISGRIVHYRYNPGKKLAAFAEKSSSRTSSSSRTAAARRWPSSRSPACWRGASCSIKKRAMRWCAASGSA